MSAAFMDDRLLVDSVMARVAMEPLPTPARALRTAIASFDRGLAGGALWTAWHLATSRSLAVRSGLRLRSAVLLAMLLLAVIVGTALAAAGAVVLVETITDSHAPVEMTTNGGGSGPASDGGVRDRPIVAAPTDTPGFAPVGGSREATPSPAADSPPDEPGGDNPGDDGSSGGGSSGGDNSGPGGGDGQGEDEHSPDPSEAPEATERPQATEAPEPSERPEPIHAGEDGDRPGDGQPR